MTHSEIETKVRALVEWLDPDTKGFAFDALLVDDLGFDSLDVANLTVEIDTVFGIELPEDAKVSTADDVVVAVEAAIKKQGAVLGAGSVGETEAP